MSVAILGLVGFVLLSVSIPVLVSFLLDLRAHEGVSYFKRRRVLRQGLEAKANVLSSNILLKSTGRRHEVIYSVVYEVAAVAEPPFRAKGCEVMYLSDPNARRLREGSSVEVRYDPADHTVVLVRIDTRTGRRDREAALRAREEELLKGRPPR
jgi:hypothetical protein